MRRVVAAWVVLVASAASARPTLERVAMSGATVVRVETTVAVVPIARTLPAGDGLPDRIYVDLPGVDLGKAAREIPASAAPVVRIRTGQFDRDTTRVVVDLEGPVDFRVETQGRVVRLVLVPPAELADSPPPPPSVPGNARPLVVLDAGHGGRDPGATGVGGVREKDVVLEIVQVLATKLPARLPVDVLLTRHDDSYLPLDRRLPSPAEHATLFLSLHANACIDARAGGLEVFYGGGDAGPAALLGREVEEALRAHLGRVRGEARPGHFAVLSRSPVPGALVEIGYLTHPDDARRAQDALYQERVTDALVDGVAAFLRDSPHPL